MLRWLHTTRSSGRLAIRAQWLALRAGNSVGDTGRNDVRIRSMVVFGFMLVLLPMALTAQTDVTGTWTMTFMTDQGNSPATLVLEQDGETLTGELVSDQGTIEFEGTVMGNALKWAIEVDAGGQFIEISMDGTVEGDEITGTADFGGYGGGSWTATRD